MPVIPSPSPIDAIDDNGGGYVDAISDLLSGTQYGIDSFAGTNRDDSDPGCCAKCECNCDVFTDFFSPRTPDVTVDRVGNPLWELVSGTMPTLASRAYSLAGLKSSLVFTAPATLICKASALRYNNFSAALAVHFLDQFTPGQQIEWIFNYTDSGDYWYWLIETITLPGNFNLPPIQPYRVQTSLWHSGDTSPRFKKYLSTPPENTGLIHPGIFVMQIKPGYCFMWNNTGWFSPAGLTFDNFAALSSGKMGLKVRSAPSDEIRVFMFRIHENYEATNRPRCQDHVWGMETGPTDNYPANKYSVSFTISPGGIGFGDPIDVTGVVLDDMVDHFNAFLAGSSSEPLSQRVQHFTYKKTIPRPSGTGYGSAEWDVYFTTSFYWQTALHPVNNGPTLLVDTRTHNPFELQFHTCGRTWEHLYSSGLGASRSWSSMALDPLTSGDPNGLGSLGSGIPYATVTAIHP